VPCPDDAALHELHSTQYYRNGEGVRFASPFEWLVEGMRRWRVHRLSHFVRSGRALDIGCGSGRFLRALRQTGWEVAGLELNDDTATAARTVHGLIVETELGAFADISFDLITITHVLEHIRDPHQMLVSCARLLKPGGVIAVAVPNIDSWQARWTRGNWFHLDLPRHLWHFSETSLSSALNELGFELIKVRRLDLAHNIFGWMQSFLNQVGLRHNRLYSFLSSDDLETDNMTHYVSLFVSIAVMPLLLPVSILLAALEAVSHDGGTVEIIARRAADEDKSEGSSE
jgi:2-polyprenyl-3-methyl-5-hydroxy-6-metoxy-1,4-benzoquinol methylase